MLRLLCHIVAKKINNRGPGLVPQMDGFNDRGSVIIKYGDLLVRKL